MTPASDRFFGPEIICKAISATRIADRFGNHWQYHSQSDRHSKISCWAVMFDLMLHCSLLRQHAADGKVGFGINLELKDFQTNRKKNLDLVVCTPGALTSRKLTGPPDLVSLGTHLGIELNADATSELASLPPLLHVHTGSVNVALEAKATMTEHIKALPRLHDELDSSHATVHGHSDHAIAVALAMVNVGGAFLSPNRNKWDLGTREPDVNSHSQPYAAERTIDKIREIRRRSGATQHGFDAVGVIVIDFKNDGGPCRITEGPPAPPPGDIFHYREMIRKVSSLYSAKFNSL